jgi:hypothetical protein
MRNLARGLGRLVVVKTTLPSLGSGRAGTHALPRQRHATGRVSTAIQQSPGSTTGQHVGHPPNQRPTPAWQLLPSFARARKIKYEEGFDLREIPESARARELAMEQAGRTTRPRWIHSCFLRNRVEAASQRK